MTTKPTTQNVEAQPELKQKSYEIQRFDQLRLLPLGIPEEAVRQSVGMLNQILADSITLYQLYKKNHWQVAGSTFYELHQFFDKSAHDVRKTIDLLAERVQSLGGVAVAMPADVAEMSKLERPPKGGENIPALLARTVNAHATIIKEVRDGIEMTEKNRDWGTNDLLMSEIIRLHEMQLWMVSQHLVDTPIVRSDGSVSRA